MVYYGRRKCKYRPPFPRLPQLFPEIVPAVCSVCAGQFTESGPLQYWISWPVAKDELPVDVLPLLVHACSRECVDRLPSRPEDFQRSLYGHEWYENDPNPEGHYVVGPHQGGLELPQPEGWEDWLFRTYEEYDS